jgi:hypothetical protein
MKKTRILVLLSALFCSLTASAQEITLTLEARSERLTPSQRDYLSEFTQKIMTYVNERRWTDTDFRGDKIPVNMQLDFLTGSDGGEFSAQVVIVSQRRLWEDGRPTPNSAMIFRTIDAKWSFSYYKGQPLFFDEFQFEDLRSFIDFYMYMIIALDYDSYELMAGTPYYQKASMIAQRSQSSTRSAEWLGTSNQYSRMNFLGEIQNAQFESFRTALYWYFYEGLDFMATEKEDAQKAVAKSIEDIADALTRTNARSLILTMWLESKSNEFCTLLDGYAEKKKLMTLMMQADPSRSEVYRRCSF